MAVRIPTTLAVLLGLTFASPAVRRARADRAGVEAALEEHLTAGRLDAAEEEFAKRSDESPDDDTSRYALGMVRILRAVENLGQNLHRYGLQPQQRGLPFVRLPVPPNPDPERITYEKWRGIFQKFVEDLDAADETLSKIDDPHVKVKVPVGMIRLDLDGDGRATEAETFWKVFTTVAWRAAKLDEDQKRFEIGFDRADVHWMIGYSHVLRALAEGLLAHDTQRFFETLAPQFFAGAQRPAVGLNSGRGNQTFFDPDDLANLIAAIHLARFEPVEPKRLKKARQHLKAMIGQSRRCFEHALAETDDDREWIPNAKQTSLTPLEVTAERIAAWGRFLDEAEAVLDGEKLLPHWRIRKPGVGINLKRVFEEPRTLDVVMWAHGAAALPYVEEGEVITRETARNLSRAFQGRFLAFAVWFQ